MNEQADSTAAIRQCCKYGHRGMGIDGKAQGLLSLVHDTKLPEQWR